MNAPSWLQLAGAVELCAAWILASRLFAIPFGNPICPIAVPRFASCCAGGIGTHAVAPVAPFVQVPGAHGVALVAPLLAT